MATFPLGRLARRPLLGREDGHLAVGLAGNEPQRWRDFAGTTARIRPGLLAQRFVEPYSPQERPQHFHSTRPGLGGGVRVSLRTEPDDDETGCQARRRRLSRGGLGVGAT
eukprot:13953541-Alexandrium_andersonii.AAC.1